MKDLTIKADRIRKELFFLGISFVVALLINFVSIIIYKTSLIELITTLHITAILTIPIYFLFIFIRFISHLIGLLIKRWSSGI
jgi:hypothetical protein